MAENINKHLSKLAKRGPHRVLVGDLDYAGIPGKIYTPAEGNGMPAIAFGHDWMKDISAYHTTLRHLASWGIVVAAPNTEKGIRPNHRGFANDLETALQILVGVKLGTGNVTVAPGRLGIVGHGMGAAAAVLAAPGRNNLRAVAAVFPSSSTPPAEAAASAITVPGLVIGPEESSPLFDYGNAPGLALAWGGECAYREVKKSDHHTLSDGSWLKAATGTGSLFDGAARERVRGLLTGFLLHQLAGERKYSGFSAPDASAKGVTSFTADELLAKSDITSSPLSLR